MGSELVQNDVQKVLLGGGAGEEEGVADGVNVGTNTFFPPNRNRLNGIYCGERVRESQFASGDRKGALRRRL